MRFVKYASLLFIGFMLGVCFLCSLLSGIPKVDPTSVLNTITNTPSEMTSTPQPKLGFQDNRNTLEAGMTLVSGHMTQTVIAYVSPTSTPLPTQTILPAVIHRVGALCNDGTYSDATSTGACSQHEGVSCWQYSDGTCELELH